MSTTTTTLLSSALPPPNVTVSRASRRDTDQIFEVVNAAFKVEVGNEGLAYRSQDRFGLKDHVRKCLDDLIVIKDQKRVRVSGFLLNFFVNVFLF